MESLLFSIAINIQSDETTGMFRFNAVLEVRLWTVVNLVFHCLVPARFHPCNKMCRGIRKMSIVLTPLC
jgi:hypothetical protein